MVDNPIRLFVGIDWATQEHAACSLRPDGSKVEERSFKHSGNGLAELVQWLSGFCEGRLGDVAVAIEVPHGAVVETLLEHGCQVFALNPKQLDRFRDRFSLAGAKDDRRDAFVLADSLRTDTVCFRKLQVDQPLVIEIREWSRIYEELGQEKLRHTNRLREQLRRYFPQYLELAPDAVGDDWFLELWKRIPTPAEAKRVRASTVAKILRENRIRRVTAEQVLQCLRQRPVIVAAGTEKAAVAHIRLVVDRLAVTNRQIRQCQEALDTLLEKFSEKPADKESAKGDEQPSDAEILRSMPGVGRIVLAVLLAEAADPLRHRDYQALRSLSGVAPVTVRSGKSFRVIMRQACHPRLRTACYHWARVAMQHDAASRALYSGLRQRGHSHGRALRGVADRLLLVACSMLRNRTLYDPNRNKPPTAMAVPA
jgi:transposase